MSLRLMSELNLSEGDLLFPNLPHVCISAPLAVKFGLSSAIIMGYLHEALQTPTRVVDEVPWIEKSCAELGEEIDCLSETSIRRHIKKLEDAGLLKSCRMSTKQYRQTKSYTICYDAVEKITQA